MRYFYTYSNSVNLRCNLKIRLLRTGSLVSILGKNGPGMSQCFLSSFSSISPDETPARLALYTTDAGHRPSYNKQPAYIDFNVHRPNRCLALLMYNFDALKCVCCAGSVFTGPT